MGTYTFVRQLTREKLKLGMSTYVIAALLVFFATASATMYYFYTQNSNVQRDITSAFDNEIRTTESSITQRMQSYEDILRGGAGLFNASNNEVSGDAWRIFIGEFNVPQRYPGVSGFGYLPRVSRQNAAEFTERTRQNGMAGYTITPGGDRDEYYPVAFVEPYSDGLNSVIGFDMYSEPARRTAMLTARDTGLPTATAKLILKQDRQHTDARPGFLIFMPIYQPGAPIETSAQRDQSLQGYIYAPFRAGELLTNILSADTAKQFAFKIYDGDSTSTSDNLFESSNYSEIFESSAHLFRTRQYKFANHTWTMQYTASKDLLPQRERISPLSTLIRGLLTGLFFAIVVYYLLANRANKLATQKAQEVQNAKDELLSLASHQLRTPATVVKQYVGMILHGYVGKLSAQQRTMLQKAYDSNERQLNIINQILYVARLDAGRIKLNTEKLAINQLLRDVVREHTESIKESGQHLRVKIPRKNYRLPADRQYLHMAIDNIISNASKYTPDDGTISISLVPQKSSVDIIVSDTGIGIEEASIPFVFEKFTRIDNEMSAQNSGSGIGLYLAGQIVSLHGGSIKVDSVANKGSTFVISLPLHPRKASAPDDKA